MSERRPPRHVLTPEEQRAEQDELAVDHQQPEVSTPTPEAPESSASPETPEQPPTPEQQQDAANRFTDAELLGKSYPVRRLVSAIGNERVRAWESAKANTANAWDTPGKWVKQGLHDRASRKVDEINVNHKADRAAALKAGGPKRLLEYRLARIDKRYNRKRAKWGGKLDRRKQSLNTHVNRMNARTEAVKNDHEKRLAETRASYKAKKEKALARKSLRRELRTQGASWHETFAVMKDIPASQRKRIGEAALLAHASKKSASSAERSAEQSERRASGAERSMLNNIAKSEQFAGQAREADQTIEDITNNSIPEAQANLDALQEQLGQLADDDPERTGLLVKIQETEEQIKIYEERELPYWHSVAKNNRQQVDTLLSERAALQRAYQDHQETAARHFETAESKRATADEYTRQHAAATNEVLNSDGRN